MGNRRVGRKRLYQLEKLGQAVDLGAGVGIKSAIKSATQHRNGQELITEIAIDLGVTGILGGGGDNGVIGKSGAASNITQLTVAKYGIITEIRAVLLEVPAGGCTILNVVTNSSTNTAQDADLTSDERCAAMNVVGEDTSAAFDDHSSLGQNGTAHTLYLTAGDGNNAQMTQGKILIYIHGFEVPADL